MEGWARVVEAAGIAATTPAGVRVATLILNDSEVERLRSKRMTPSRHKHEWIKAGAILNDRPNEPLKVIGGRVLSMTPQQRDRLQASVIAKYQAKRNTNW